MDLNHNIMEVINAEELVTMRIMRVNSWTDKSYLSPGDELGVGGLIERIRNR
jgi:hypothetical protein